MYVWATPSKDCQHKMPPARTVSTRCQSLCLLSYAAAARLRPNFAVIYSCRPRGATGQHRAAFSHLFMPPQGCCRITHRQQELKALQSFNHAAMPLQGRCRTTRVTLLDRVRTQQLWPWGGSMTAMPCSAMSAAGG